MADTYAYRNTERVLKLLSRAIESDYRQRLREKVAAAAAEIVAAELETTMEEAARLTVERVAVQNRMYDLKQEVTVFVGHTKVQRRG